MGAHRGAHAVLVAYEGHLFVIRYRKFHSVANRLDPAIDDCSPAIVGNPDTAMPTRRQCKFLWCNIV